MIVPFLDLRAHHAHLRHGFHDALDELLDSCDFSQGAAVENFEASFSHYCGTTHAVAVGSGTDALWLTLVAYGIGLGDEVITVPMTFVATVEAICLSGARPVFVDIDPLTYTIDTSAIEKRITPRTKAIIPVHLFGQPADMDPILKIAQRHSLLVIEDAAQAHGAEYHGKKTGSLGDAGCFSFYPGKNLGAIGEAGAVTTNNREIAAKIKMLGNHGQHKKNQHSTIGCNSRMDTFHALILSLKLKTLERENQQRRRNSLIYHHGLKSISQIIIPELKQDQLHAQHVYAIQTARRTSLIDSLKQEMISYGIHYPTPIHRQAAYRYLDYQKGDFPVSESCSTRFLSLPMHPYLTNGQIQHVITTIQNFFDKTSPIDFELPQAYL
jgi:dTDP-4-amino-4,6-dideoxygalactose transaminase